MKTQFYAVGIDDDQPNGWGGVVARQHGREADMRAFIGQFPGNSTHFYANATYHITRDSDEAFRDDQGAPLPGAIYKLVEW